MSDVDLYTKVYGIALERIGSSHFTTQQRVQMAKDIVDVLWVTSLEQSRLLYDNDEEVSKIFFTVASDLFNI